MREMGMKMRDAAAGQEFVDQIPCLKQMLEGCRFFRAQKPQAGRPQSRRVASGPPCGQDQVLRQQKWQGGQKGFRKIVHRGRYPADAGVGK